MTKLSVNLNKLALLRNQRDVGYPSVVGHAKIILEAGAQGLTVHPRPDERHIRKSDISDIVAFLEDWENKDIEFNIEGYPSEEFLDLVCQNSCHQITLVPDAPDQRTSDHGWNVAAHKDRLKNVIKRLKDNGRRVSLFIDPVPELIKQAADVGADRIELYTGPYAEKKIHLEDYVLSAVEAEKADMGINAGHDLSLNNLAQFIAAIPQCDEVSIGHAITADALLMGWGASVNAYLSAIQFGQKMAHDKLA